MTAVIAPHHVLSDSTQRTRPAFGTYFLSDNNAGGNSVQQIEQKRQLRQMKFPSLIGRKDVDSFKDVINLTDSAYKKWNDVGDHHALSPLRSCDNIVDPTSGFVSVAGDVDRHTGHSGIAYMGQLSDHPQDAIPQLQHSIRMHHSAPPELQRQTEKDPGSPYTWNGRVKIDGLIRAELGGWTSKTDPRIAEGEKKNGSKPPPDPATALRDKLALRYMYTSSTQRSYEEVPWDNSLHKKRWPPVTTLEERPDMISQRWTKKRYDSAAEDWQAAGRSWDRVQTRRGYYKDGPMGIAFCSPCPRSQQIPLYSGCIGARNLDEIDNAKEPFRPYTIKRVSLPRYTDTSHRPNIPGYAGCTLYQPDSKPAHSMPATPEPQTTARVHRAMPVTPNTSQFKRDSQMSKMVTTVPPCNPFNKIEKETVDSEL